MVPQFSAVARLALDPATTEETLATIFGAQRRDPDRTPAQLQSQREAGVALIAAFHPRDPREAAYAVRAAAAHYGAMECFRRAMLPDTPDNAVIRWHGKAVALSRMNTEMVRTLRECQAEAPRAQSPAQPAARPAMPASPIRAVAAGAAAPRPAAAPAATGGASASPEKPADRQACPPGRSPVAGARAVDPRDPMSSERKSPASAGPATMARPDMAPPPAAGTGIAAATQAQSVGRQDPMSSERPSFTPAASAVMTGPAATSFLSAPPPRQGQRARLLGSTADIAAMLAAAKA